MIQLLIIADDFTGAIDTGVQLAAKGANTRVMTRPDIDLRTVDEHVQVLVLDMETRHISPQDAYRTVYHIVSQSMEMGIPYIYKKTDSALRGNIGAELSALLDASGVAHLPFLPAFPQIGRTTENGIHYINGVPVDQSVFGNDPFEPVRVSDVTKLIGLQSQASVETVSVGEFHREGKQIQVYDALTAEDLVRAGEWLAQNGQLQVAAGCAGFGSILPRLIGLEGSAGQLPHLDSRLLVLCGSVNPVTQEQLEMAEQNGFARIRLTPEQKLTPGYFDTESGKATLDTMRRMLAENPHVIIDTNDLGGNEATMSWALRNGLSIDDVRTRVSGVLGDIMLHLFDSPDLGTLLVTGGDTLLQCMNSVNVYELVPVGELFTGTVLSSFTIRGRTKQVISKSGGFGEPTLLTDLVRTIS